MSNKKISKNFCESNSSTLHDQTTAKSLDMGDYFIGINNTLEKCRGISWVMAAFFVIADMVGGGIVALPKAVFDCCKLLY